MPYVACEKVSKGLRDSERTVSLRDVDGRREFIRVEHDFLYPVNGKTYLPVGVVQDDRDNDLVLIELSHEGETGRNRLWVQASEMLQPTSVPA